MHHFKAIEDAAESFAVQTPFNMFDSKILRLTKVSLDSNSSSHIR